MTLKTLKTYSTPEALLEYTARAHVNSHLFMIECIANGLSSSEGYYKGMADEAALIGQLINSAEFWKRVAELKAEKERENEVKEVKLSSFRPIEEVMPAKGAKGIEGWDYELPE